MHLATAGQLGGPGQRQRTLALLGRDGAVAGIGGQREAAVGAVGEQHRGAARELVAQLGALTEGSRALT